ncbi:hypothetical protein HN51_029626 [Arachis hypogaea]|uniref:Transmembrane protein n=1 Tax=Arachis hypogaea TaxID=3818 RepID=A0A445BDZ9_ARAHY|nr:transmembrane protein 53 [Arachis hypogaea]XP_025620873.1 transmembrane protein 53 [Arachis hypogaea]QHO36304.1 Transmembrane protein-B [Arachis hypogaea]RYR36914.1 hypothetical protein Ahy_A09g041865 [Arachis hypogaea]
MSNFSGAIQRPLVAAAAVAVASFSAEFSDKFPSSGTTSSSTTTTTTTTTTSDYCSTSNLAHSTACNSIQQLSTAWVSHISVSKLADLSFVTRIPAPLPNVKLRVPSLGHNCASNFYHSSVASSPLLWNVYRSAEFSRLPRPCVHSRGVSTSSSEGMYEWHLPQPSAVLDGSSVKSKTVVVLLGWLGAKQRHLNKYAEWYTSKGYHVITFTFPMDEVLSYKPGGKAEQNVHLLVDHLADWLEGENEKNMVFHTFSNTGWLTYGVILEQCQKQGLSIMDRIKGCIVDSAPVAYPDPEVWASGFSAAFLKKRSVATKGYVTSNESGIKVSIGREEASGPKPALTEAALLLILKKFFEITLNLPTVNRRLSDVLNVLSSKQPSCPQLYIYSTADRVIPADSVESFVEAQRKSGHDVRACNFVSSPHVDHFRNHPKLYTSQVNQFLDECVVNKCKSSH